MPREIHLGQIDDAEGSIQVAVARLEAGQLVLLPDESGWNLAGLARHGSAAVELSRLPMTGTQAVATVSVADPEIVADYVTNPAPLFLKLAARCWPGPVILRTGSSQVEGLARQWPTEARHWGLSRAGRAFFCPAEGFTQSVLKAVSAPVLSIVGTAEERIYEPIQEMIGLLIHPREVRFPAAPTLAAIADGQIHVECAGVVSERMLARLAGNVYLFVCTGNTCRSPMAEAMFRKMLADRLKCREDELLDRGFVVISAGLAAHHGSAASPEAVELLREQGIDLSAHESQPVTEELLFHCDRIFTMTGSHRDALLSAYPELADQVRLLSPRDQDVPDPIGAGIDEYVRCRDEIASHLRQLLNEIDFSRK